MLGLPHLLIVCACLLSAAYAVAAPTAWVWVDERGQRVFSDMPPPAHVPDGRILQRPQHAAAPIATPAPTPAAAPAPAAAANPQDAQRRTEAQVRAIEQRNTEIRADNCQRARNALAVLAGGGRLATVNESGQPVAMTPAMRQTERTRLEQVISENCQ